jgi:hypothetical protein
MHAVVNSGMTVQIGTKIRSVLNIESDLRSSTTVKSG